MRLGTSASLLLAGLAVTGCVPTSYLGLSTSGPPSENERQILEAARSLSPMLTGSCTDAATGIPINCALLPKHALAMAAAMGDKHAQLELGKRFEAGRGVEKDLVKAEKLYKRASRTSGGDFTTCVWDEYTKSCNFITISQPYVYGLPEAKTRLADLQERLAVTQPDTAGR